MARRPNVPAFGNWEKEQDVPYTVFFEKARKGKKGEKMINPNDPDAFSTFAPPAPAPAPTRAPPPPQPKPEPIRHLGNSGSRHKQPGVRDQINSGEPQRRHPRPSERRSFDRTPPPSHMRNADSSWDGRDAPDSNQGTYGKPRSNSHGRGDGNPGRGAAVPKFGEWDEKNPASADGFTHIFQKVREEKYTAREVRSPVVTGRPPLSTPHKSNKNDKAKARCLPWLWG